jgi:hypothetical protein
MSAEKPSPDTPHKGAKPLLLVLAAAITLVLLMLVIRAGFQASWRSEGDAVLAELSAEGVGIDGLFPNPPDKNGAPKVRKAAASLEPLPERAQSLPGTRPSILKAALADPNSESAYMLGVFADRKELEEAIQVILSKLESCEPDLDAGLRREVVYRADWDKGLEAELPFLSEVRGLLEALCLRAGWRSAQGDAPGAYADLERCLRLAKSFNASQLIVRLVQMAVNARCVEILEDLLNQGPAPQGDQRSRILALLKDLERVEGVTPSLRGELHAFAVMSDQVPLLAGEDAPPGSNLLWGYWRKEHFKEMAALIRASRLPEDEFQTYVEEFEVRLPKEGNTLSKLLMPSIGRFVTKNRTDRARLRLAIWGLELAQWDELPPKSSGAPKDPFTLDTKPCHFKREGRGALLWSIGEDGRDAKGVSGMLDGGPDDITFRLLRK